jgi:hypothetical protein
MMKTSRGLDRAGGRQRGRPWIVALAIAAFWAAAVQGSRAPLASTARLPSLDLLSAGARCGAADAALLGGRQACREAGAAAAVMRPGTECGLLRLRGGMLIYKDSGTRPRPPLAHRARAPGSPQDRLCSVNVLMALCMQQCPATKWCPIHFRSRWWMMSCSR